MLIEQCIVSNGFAQEELILCQNHAIFRRERGEQVQGIMPVQGVCHDCRRMMNNGFNNNGFDNFNNNGFNNGFGNNGFGNNGFNNGGNIVEEIIEEIIDPFDNNGF